MTRISSRGSRYKPPSLLSAFRSSGKRRFFDSLPNVGIKYRVRYSLSLGYTAAPSLTLGPRNREKEKKDRAMGHRGEKRDS